MTHSPEENGVLVRRAFDGLAQADATAFFELMAEW